LKRLLLSLVPLTLVLSACSVGDPRPATDVSDTEATLNAEVYSSVAGDTEYWWRYGEDTGYGSETPHGTVAIADDQPHAVSHPVSGLTADTTYHFMVCTSDEEESPPRVVCSTDRTFVTAPAGGWTFESSCTNELGGSYSTFQYGDPPDVTGWRCSWPSEEDVPDEAYVRLVGDLCPAGEGAQEGDHVDCFANIVND
jgi:hypothetical protein